MRQNNKIDEMRQDHSVTIIQGFTNELIAAMHQEMANAVGTASVAETAPEIYTNLTNLLTSQTGYFQHALDAINRAHEAYEQMNLADEIDPNNIHAYNVWSDTHTDLILHLGLNR